LRDIVTAVLGGCKIGRHVQQAKPSWSYQIARDPYGDTNTEKLVLLPLLIHAQTIPLLVPSARAMHKLWFDTF